MARQTRQQRRARRAQQQTGGGGDSKMVQRARARQAQVRPGATPPKSQGGQRRTPGGGARRFIAESWAELKKVEWPGQSQLIQGVVVVLVACVVVGVYLYGADLIWKRFVQDILLR